MMLTVDLMMVQVLKMWKDVFRPDRVKVSEHICDIRKSVCAFVKVNMLMCSSNEETKPYLTVGG